MRRANRKWTGYSCTLAHAVATAQSRGLLELFAFFGSHRFPSAPVAALMPAAASPETAEQDAAQNQQPQCMWIVHRAAADEYGGYYRVPKQHDHQTEKGRSQQHQERLTPIPHSVPHLSSPQRSNSSYTVCNRLRRYKTA